ncbi:hypothetical protein FMUND_6898 [Fusarium mundagurra]|uniref:Uncharacterized protein n=1 Tax=Fusarium mundagurra TaxID=1567541 RepID=A0A8H5YQB8_9HYPO|nr:hypothetical protein FMUND_6898 [Fusarium mundagurra]
MSKASTASAWPGAPPVAEDGFAFADGVFFAQSSGQNRHRRATIIELKEHFTSGNDKDHPAHWFEAQLIHYGLPPSKTKSVARMRLFDAVNAGNLKVPASVSKLETKLKKEWTKNDREAKKGTTSKPAVQATPVMTETKKPTAAGAKRKANDDEGNATAKKPKTVAPTTATPKAKAPARTPVKAPAKSTAKTAAKDPETGPAPTPALHPEETDRDGQLARADRQQENLFPKLPDSQSLRLLDAAALLRPGDEYPLHYSSDENNGSDDVDEVSLAPLGLLNGDYEVESRDTLGRFNLGVYEGVLLIEERPLRSSHDRVWFEWRGREDQGPVIYGDRNEGWMEFLGDGRIEGWLDHQSLSFQARRLPGQGTRSSIDARTLQDEWNGYSYRLYEEENRARWR